MQNVYVVENLSQVRTSNYNQSRSLFKDKKCSHSLIFVGDEAEDSYSSTAKYKNYQQQISVATLKCVIRLYVVVHVSAKRRINLTITFVVVHFYIEQLPVHSEAELIITSPGTRPHGTVSPSSCKGKHSASKRPFPAGKTQQSKELSATQVVQSNSLQE